MVRKLFGTDGVRGTANQEPITAETALRLAMAAGTYFSPVSDKQRPLAVIGKDTRLSGYMLESCLLYTSPSPRDKRQSRMPSSA